MKEIVFQWAFWLGEMLAQVAIGFAIVVLVFTPLVLLSQGWAVLYAIVLALITVVLVTVNLRRTSNDQTTTEISE